MSERTVYELPRPDDHAEQMVAELAERRSRERRMRDTMVDPNNEQSIYDHAALQHRLGEMETHTAGDLEQNAPIVKDKKLNEEGEVVKGDEIFPAYTQIPQPPSSADEIKPEHQPHQPETALDILMAKYNAKQENDQTTLESLRNLKDASQDALALKLAERVEDASDPKKERLTPSVSMSQLAELHMIAEALDDRESLATIRKEIEGRLRLSGHVGLAERASRVDRVVELYQNRIDRQHAIDRKVGEQADDLLRRLRPAETDNIKSDEEPAPTPPVQAADDKADAKDDSVDPLKDDGDDQGDPGSSTATSEEELEPDEVPPYGTPPERTDNQGDGTQDDTPGNNETRSGSTADEGTEADSGNTDNTPGNSNVTDVDPTPEPEEQGDNTDTGSENPATTTNGAEQDHTAGRAARAARLGRILGRVARGGVQVVADGLLQRRERPQPNAAPLTTATGEPTGQTSSRNVTISSRDDGRVAFVPTALTVDRMTLRQLDEANGRREFAGQANGSTPQTEAPATTERPAQQAARRRRLGGLSLNRLVRHGRDNQDAGQGTEFGPTLLPASIQTEPPRSPENSNGSSDFTVGDFEQLAQWLDEELDQDKANGNGSSKGQRLANTTKTYGL